MKFFLNQARTLKAAPDSSRVDRRGVVVGAGVAGAAALAAAALHGRIAATPPVQGEKVGGAASEAGYRETEHVLRYYETTRA